MKITKDINNQSRRLFRLCLAGNTLNMNAVQTIVHRLLTTKPRHYQPLLAALMSRVELARRQKTATITSAVELSEPEKQQIQTKLATKYGADLFYHWNQDPTLLAGLHIQVGDDVLDGTVATRIHALTKLYKKLS